MKQTAELKTTFCSVESILFIKNRADEQNLWLTQEFIITF